MEMIIQRIKLKTLIFKEHGFETEQLLGTRGYIATCPRSKTKILVFLNVTAYKLYHCRI